MVGKKEQTSGCDLSSYHERHLAGSEYHLERGPVSGDLGRWRCGCWKDLLHGETGSGVSGS
jgi:hypothetical protein